MIKEAIARVVERIDLTEAEMIEVMNEVMGGEATPAQVAAFITTSRALPHFMLVRDYHDHPDYIRSLAQSVRDYRAVHGSAGHLLLSFHGIPEVNVRKGDPYQQQCLRTGELLARELGLADNEWTPSFQSVAAPRVLSKRTTSAHRIRLTVG